MEISSNPALESPYEKTQSVDQPFKSKRKEKKIKEPRRGLGVAKLEILRMEGKLKEMNDHLEQIQAVKGSAVVPVQHQQLQQHQFQVPFPTFVDPRMQYTNGTVQGRVVPTGNGNFIFQPMTQNGGYPVNKPMNIIPNGGGGFIPASHQEHNNIIGNGGFPGNQEPRNILGNGGEGGVLGGSGAVKGGCSNKTIADNTYMILDQQLRIQHLKLLHSAREQLRLHHQMPQYSNFSDKWIPMNNNSEISKSKDRNDSCDSLELSLGWSKTIIDEEVKPVDAEMKRRKNSSSSSVLMEYDFFHGESSENRSSSYAGGEVGSCEASTSDDNTHSLDLSLKLSL